MLLLPYLENDSLFRLNNENLGPGGTDAAGDGSQDQEAFKTAALDYKSLADVCAKNGIGSTTDGNARYQFGSQHSGQIIMCLSDASVRSFRDNVALSTWQAMGTMNGGETVPTE